MTCCISYKLPRADRVPPSSCPPPAPVNDPPVLPSAALQLNTTSRQRLVTNAELLAGVTDVDSSVFTVVVVSPPASSDFTAVVDGYDFKAKGSGTFFTFTYKVNDGVADSNVRTGNITLISERRARMNVCACHCGPTSCFGEACPGSTTDELMCLCDML